MSSRVMMARLFSLLWYLIASLLIMAAVALSAARLLLPLMGDFRSDIEAHIEAVIHRNVSIGRMDAAWRGFGPSLKLQHVQIWDEQGRQVIFAVDEVLVQLDLPGSLRTGTLKTGETRLQGLELDLLRDREGRISLRGFSMPERSVDPRELLAVVFSAGEIRLVEGRIRWQDEMGQLPALQLDQVDLHLLNRGDRHRLQLSAPLPAAYGEDLALVLSVRGAPDAMDDWQGKSLLRMRGARLSAWQPWLEIMPTLAARIPEASGTLDLSLWTRFSATRFQEVAAELDLQSLQLRTARETVSSEFSLDYLQSRLLWERHPQGGWTLSGDRLTARQGGRSWPETRFSVQQRAEADATRWAAMADYVDLNMLTGLLQAMPDQQNARLQQWRQWSPGGIVQGVNLQARLQDEQLQELGLQAQFNQLSSHSWGKLPALQGISGSLHGNLQSGMLQLDSQQVRVEAAPLFRTPLSVNTAQGRFYWQRTAEQLQVKSQAFSLQNDDLQLQGKLRLDIPLHALSRQEEKEEGVEENTAGNEVELAAVRPSPFLDLALQIKDAQVESTSRYLPAGIMNPKAVEWLDYALQAGTLRQGTVVFQGPLTQFPFDNQQGRFLVQAEVENALLHYKKGWEPIEDLQAQLRFEGAAMEILGVSGRIGSAQLSEVRAWTPDLRRQGPALQVTGKAQGELDEMLRFLVHSPLGGRYRALAEQLQPSGAATLDLAMDVPMRRQHPVFSLQGKLHLDDNRAEVSQWGLTLDHLQGQIRFSHKDIGSKQLHGQLWGKPVAIALDTLVNQGRAVHRVQLQGPVDLVARVKQWEWPVASFLKGSSDWKMQLQIHEARKDQAPQVDLLLDSDLQGIAVGLPSPFTKISGQRRPLSLSRSLVAGVAGPLRVTYGDDVHALLQLESTADQGQRLERGILHFGKEAAPLPEKSEWLISGDLARVSLADWQAVLPKGKEGARVIPAVGLDLRVGELEIYHRVLRNVGMKITKTGKVWACDFDGPTALGQLRLEQGEEGIRQIDVNLDHLQLETIEGPPGLPQTLKMDPRKLPSLNIRTRHLQYDDRVLGSLELKTLSGPRGMKVERLLLNSPDYVFAVEGDWLQGNEGWQSSHFQVQLKNGNLGNLLEALGRERSLETENANAKLRAHWPGSPLEFDLEKVEGTLTVDFGDGQLPKVDAAAGRILNILSIHTLHRRLSLDFSDLFGKGFSFDKLFGEVSFEGGNAYSDGLSIHGPAAQIEISGRTGFLHRDYDQLITVTPLVSSNLPLAGALAGGPVVGAALFVAEKLLGERMNRLARYQYEVTGSWDAPELKRLTLPEATETEAAPALNEVQ